jgi:cytochrome c-type biogenesis protein CcmH
VIRLAVLLAALALVAFPAQALAATPRASLADLEDEVMCVECGTPLEVSQSPVANQERALIRRDIRQGKTKAQIKDDLVAEYGEAVLADPPSGGINTAVWLVPTVVVLAAALTAGLTARRWRRRGATAGAPAPADEPRDAAGAALDPADAKRLDAELAAYDS